MTMSEQLSKLSYADRLRWERVRIKSTDPAHANCEVYYLGVDLGRVATKHYECVDHSLGFSKRFERNA